LCQWLASGTIAGDYVLRKDGVDGLWANLRGKRYRAARINVQVVPVTSHVV